MSDALYSGKRIDTGTGAARRPLTTEESAAGCLPEPFTADEWTAMRAASAMYAERLFVESMSKWASWWGGA